MKIRINTVVLLTFLVFGFQSFGQGVPMTNEVWPEGLVSVSNEIAPGSSGDIWVIATAYGCGAHDSISAEAEELDRINNRKTVIVKLNFRYTACELTRKSDMKRFNITGIMRDLKLAHGEDTRFIYQLSNRPYN